MRSMGLDVGDRTIGIAVSDLLALTAQGVEVIRRTSPQADFARLTVLCQEYEVGTIVVGLPKNMDGTEGARAEKTRKMASLLTAIVDVPVELWDERSTTVSAANILSDNGTFGKKRKQVLDAVAATVILESYLAYRKNQT